MTAPTRGPLTRGPLPARVYWRRRLAVLGVAMLMVVGIARLLGSGSDGSDSGDRASLADAAVSAAEGATSAAPTSAAPTAPSTEASTPVAPTSTTPTLAVPDGPCVDSDLAVTPEVTRAIAGPQHGVTIDLQVRTIRDEACTWAVSPRTLTMKITSGKDDIWSSRDCPRALPRQTVTVRRAASTTLTVQWNARRSDEECSKLTAWAMPGYYHVSAAALAGEPSEVQFELLAPQPATVTRTADPKQAGRGEKAQQGTKAKARQDRKKRRGQQPTTPTEEPAATGEPSGAVEP